MGQPVDSLVRHGMASCKRYGCKKPECVKAGSRANKELRVNASQGLLGTVPAAEASSHAKVLLEAGMPPEEMASWTGLAKTTINSILSGRSERIYRDTAEAILFLPIPPKGYKTKYSGLISALPSQRMLRALTAIGFTIPALIRETGSNREVIGGVRQGRRHQVRIGLDRAITEAYNRLWNVDPVAYGIPVGDVKRAKGWAAKQGWPPPAAWDDEDLRNPDGRPKGRWGNVSCTE